MAITPTIDAVVNRIASLQALAAAIDGVTPITLTIGTASQTINPSNSPDAYQAMASFITRMTGTAIAKLRDQLASLSVTQSQLP